MVLWFSFIPSILSHCLLALSYDSFLCNSIPLPLPFPPCQETETFQYRWFTMLTSMKGRFPTPGPGPLEPRGENVLPGNQMKFILLQRQHIDDIAFLAQRKAKKIYIYIICSKSTWNEWIQQRQYFKNLRISEISGQSFGKIALFPT